MNHRRGAAPAVFKFIPEKKNAGNIFKKCFYAFMILVAIALFLGGVGKSGEKGGDGEFIFSGKLPTCASTAGGTKLTPESPVKTIQLDPRCWTGPIVLPVGVDYRIDNHPGEWHEVMFLDGKRMMVSVEDDMKWAGTIRGSSFRLRGDAPATITMGPVERDFSRKR